MGKRLSLDEKTVRVRVRRLEESGFVKYYQASPSLALFGLRHVSLFRLEALNLATKFAVIRGLDGVSRLVESSDFLGPSMTVSVAGATPEEARAEADRLAAHYELGTTMIGDRAIAPPSSGMDLLDWKIIKALRYDAKSGDKALAEALSVTQRMVGYRVSKLLGSGAIRIRAVIDPKMQAGLVFYELEIHTEADRQRSISRWLNERYGSRLWQMASPTVGVLLASLFCFTLAEPEESVVEALSQRGVKRCTPFVLKEVIEPKRPNWIDSLIDFRIASQTKEQGARRPGGRASTRPALYEPVFRRGS